jgi:hypothetical protein
VFEIKNDACRLISAGIHVILPFSLQVQANALPFLLE